MALHVGSITPDFTLYSDEEEPFHLADCQGDKNVVLLFFPGAFTSVCTDELNTVSNDLESFGGAADTVVVGISTDSPFALREFRKVNQFQLPLLSDHDGTMSEKYGAKYDHDFTPMKLDRIAKRAAFVIDKEGVVQYAEVLDNAGILSRRCHE
ncbi:MAG TPA: redoxin domain-containing protein [Rhodothermales bacterium]|nr:redoxin domain-containing protein [Rhodothermales bacterium]